CGTSVTDALPPLSTSVRTSNVTPSTPGSARGTRLEELSADAGAAGEDSQTGRRGGLYTVQHGLTGDAEDACGSTNLSGRGAGASWVRGGLRGVSGCQKATPREGFDQFADLAAAGAAIRPGLQAFADRRDAAAAWRRGCFQNLVSPDVKAGADGRPAVAALGAGSSGQQPQPRLGRDVLVEPL